MSAPAVVRDPGRVFLSVLALWFALSPGSLPAGPDGAAASLRALLAAASVLILPGALLGPVLSSRGIALPGFRSGDGFLSRFAGSAALSLGVGCPAMFLLLLLGASWGAAEGLFRVGMLGLLAVRWRAEAPGPPPPASRGEALLGALAAVAAVAALRMGAVSGSDAAVHRSVLRALLRSPSLGSPAEILLAGEGADPRYALPVWHALLALSARIAAVDPDAVWHALPGVLSMAPVGAAVLLGRALFRSDAAGARSGAVALFLFTLLGQRPATRLAGYYQIEAHYVIYPCAWAVLLGFLREGDRRRLWILALLSFASAAVNPFYGFVLLAVSLASAGAWRLAARGPWRPLLAATAAAFLAAAPVMALRARGVEVRNAAYLRPEAASAGFRAELVQAGGSRFRFAPWVLLEVGFWAPSILQGLALVLAPLAIRGRALKPEGAFLGATTLVPLAVLPCPLLCTAASRVLTAIYASHLGMLIPAPYLLAGLARDGAAGDRRPAGGWGWLVVSAGIALLLAAGDPGLHPPDWPPGRLGWVRGESRDWLRQARANVRAAVLGVEPEDAVPGLEGVTAALRARPRGVFLAPSEVGLMVSARTGFPGLHVPAFYASPSAGDLPERERDARAILDPSRPAAERGALLARWSVRYAVVPAGKAGPLASLGFREAARSLPWVLLERAPPPE